MKQRNIAVCIILSIITCGIYSLYWYVVMTNEANQLSGRPGYTSGGVSLLLMIITCIIYGLYWAYQMGEKIDLAKQMRGWPAGNNGVVYLILQLVFPIAGYALMQNEINHLIAPQQPGTPPQPPYNPQQPYNPQ